MWSSIKEVIKPENMTEALALAAADTAAFFAGGSYLVAQQSSKIQMLVDINHLLDHAIVEHEQGLQVGAGCSLQELLGQVSAEFARAIRASCPSKNIRNQRSLGGEIAQARSNSDLYILLLASSASLFVNETPSPIPFSEWDGKGIINKVLIPLETPRFERVAVLDSAPAYVIVAVDTDSDSTRLAVGGKVSRPVLGKFSLSPQADEVIAFLAEVREVFVTDYLGSQDYKHQLATRLINELMVQA